MARDDPHFRLRIPADLKAEIEQAAAQNLRSMNAEIIFRLLHSFDPDAAEKLKELNATVETVRKNNKTYMTEMISLLNEASRTVLKEYLSDALVESVIKDTWKHLEKMSFPEDRVPDKLQETRNSFIMDD